MLLEEQCRLFLARVTTIITPHVRVKRHAVLLIVLHLRVATFAQLGVVRVELAVPALQKISLRVKKLWVAVHVDLAVHFSQV